MAHDSHFLSRLSRVTAVQADMALELYRDPGRVQYILAHVSLPEGYERVAIALEDSDDSPHVIVDRNGVFITCLAAGMTFGDCPRISRPQLDRLGHKWEFLSKAASERLSKENDLLALRNRLTRAGPTMSREDMVLLSAFHPAIRDDIFGSKITEGLVEFVSRYRSHKYRGRRLNEAQRSRLRNYWQLTWGVAHMAALGGEHVDLTLSDMRHARAVMPWEREEITPEWIIAWPAMRTLAMPAVIRGAWQIARGGQQLLSEFKRCFDTEVSSWATFINCSVGLYAIGLRHSRLRHEVSRVLARRNAPFFKESYAAGYCDAFLSMFCHILTHADVRELLRAEHRISGAHLAVKLTSGRPEGHPYRYQDPASVPDEVAFPLALCLDGPIIHRRRPSEEEEDMAPPNLYLVAMALAWAAKANFEELYLPAAFWEGIKLVWTPEVSLDLLDGQSPLIGMTNQPVRAAAKTGRNQPCPCNSGKKYKRCCGAVDTDQAPASDEPAMTSAEDYAPILAALLNRQKPE